tara:strand:+ start:1144 stop:1347 length:204 start_codon:yes stop_codon:yes gene_type:complete
MTRKDFQLIADVVANIDDSATRDAVALNFGVKLRRTNDRFNMQRFITACCATPPTMTAVADATDRHC